MRNRQQAQTWLLLAIIVSMQLVNAFHFHEPQPVVAEVECDMCAHHMHHSGHFTGDQYHMHPCLSCEISNNNYITPNVTHLATIQQRVEKLESELIQVLPVVNSSNWQSRAPPVI